MTEIRHIGRVIRTGKKVLVAFRTLPNDAFNCLVIPTESLEDSMHDSLMNLIGSSSAQEAFELAEVLNRAVFPDGSRMLPALHARGKLVKAPTDAIEMTPAPGVTLKLSELNQLIAESRGVSVNDLSVKPSENDVPAEKPMDASHNRPTTQPVENSISDPTAGMESSERMMYYVQEAQRLAQEAQRLIEHSQKLLMASETVKSETKTEPKVEEQKKIRLAKKPARPAKVKTVEI